MLQTDFPKWGRRRQRNRMLAMTVGRNSDDIRVTVSVPTVEPVPKGHCRKCGRHIGRGVMLHAKKCKG